jgi:hypothetical protein
MQPPVNHSDRWLLLVHQLPAKPDYLRAKVGRRLARLGAVAVKNSVYVLPNDAERQEDLQWLLREIADGGGEGWLVTARFLGGLDDARIEEMFRAARDEECEPVAVEARALLDRGVPEDRAGFVAELARLRRRHDEIAAIDFFGSNRRIELDGLLRALDALLHPTPDRGGATMERGRTWVTRRGVKIDRIASAWLVCRFIDPEARFKFVEAKGYAPEPGELRFDMFDAEYTHEGDACTFEVLVRRFSVAAPGVAALAEIVHDIDLKDERYGRPETRGVAAQIEGIAAGTSDDDERLRQGFLLFDAMRRALATG